MCVSPYQSSLNYVCVPLSILPYQSPELVEWGRRFARDRITPSRLCHLERVHRDPCTIQHRFAFNSDTAGTYGWLRATRTLRRFGNLRYSRLGSLRYEANLAAEEDSIGRPRSRLAMSMARPMAWSMSR